MNYKIVYSENTKYDIEKLANIIAVDYGSPLTATRYIQGILDTINSLQHFPYSYSVRRSISLLRFGHNVRRVNYKR